MRPNPEHFSRPHWVGSLSCRRWVGYIIDTNEELPDRTIVSNHYPLLQLNSMKCRASVIATMRHGVSEPMPACVSIKKTTEMNWTVGVIVLPPESSFW